MLKLVVMLSGGGSNLQAIIDAIDSGKLKANIEAVFSNEPDAHGITRAQNARIPTHTMQHQIYASREAYDAALAQKICLYEPDLIILAGFMRILSSDFVCTFPNKILNIHPALLPKYKGLNTHKRAIEAQDSHHGSSVHIVNEDLDAGQVLAQSTCQILASDTPESLEKKVKQLEHHLYPFVIGCFASGQLTIQKDGIYHLNQKLINPLKTIK